MYGNRISTPPHAAMMALAAFVIGALAGAAPVLAGEARVPAMLAGDWGADCTRYFSRYEGATSVVYVGGDQVDITRDVYTRIERDGNSIRLYTANGGMTRIEIVGEGAMKMVEAVLSNGFRIDLSASPVQRRCNARHVLTDEGYRRIGAVSRAWYENWAARVSARVQAPTATRPAGREVPVGLDRG